MFLQPSASGNRYVGDGESLWIGMDEPCIGMGLPERTRSTGET